MKSRIKPRSKPRALRLATLLSPVLALAAGQAFAEPAKRPNILLIVEIGRASCRERVFSSV